MLEEIDGHEALKRIRDTESDFKIGGLDGAKIIMTTVLDDFASIKTAFAGQCEGYIVKPVTKDKVEIRAFDRHAGYACRKNCCGKSSFKS